MLRLEAHSSVLEESVGSRLMEGRREAAELSVCDFDSTRFKVNVQPGSEQVVKIDVDVPCWKELTSLGVKEMLGEIYGETFRENGADPGFCCALEIDCDKVKEEDKAELMQKVVYLKRNALGAPFRRSFLHLAAQEATEDFMLPWRPGEAVYCVQGSDPANPAHKDRVVVVYAVSFDDEADAAICRIVLQQFQEKKVGGAPPVSFMEANKPPREILALSSSQPPPGVGFVSFAIFKRHVDTAKKLDNAVQLVVGFRNYLMYHIKAAKTNQHMRMRKKVFDWLQVINRAHLSNAKPNDQKQMKTHSGRTFVRK